MSEREARREDVDAKLRILNADVLCRLTAGPRRGSPEERNTLAASDLCTAAIRRLHRNTPTDTNDAGACLERAATLLWGSDERPEGWPGRVISYA